MIMSQQWFEVALYEVAVIVVEMHAVAFAVAEHLAVGTVAFACPVAVSVHLEAVFPYVPDVVLVDVALIETAANRGAGRDAAIDED